MKNFKGLLLALFILCCFFINTSSVIAQNGCVQCNNTTNTGEFSSAIGQNTTSSEFVSFASGYEVMASGSFSFAHGKFLLAVGTNSVVFGKYANAVASHSMVLGYGSGNLQRLNNNVSNSLMVGFNSSVPTLFIGPSMANGYTGKIGIGNVTNPQAKLHIRADNNYDEASVYIESPNDNKPAYLWMGNKDFGIHKHSTTLEFLSTKDFVFNGNVGIGTSSSPTEKLEVNGNIKQAEGYQIETDKLLSKSRNGLKLFTSLNSGIFIDSRGQVAIGKPTPAAALDVNGKIKTSALQIPMAIPMGEEPKDIAGYVLLSRDNYGNVEWAHQSALDDGDWDKNGDNVSKTTGKVGIGTNNPSAQLHIADIGPAGSVNLKVGDDTYLSDMDQTHTLGIISVYDNNVGALMLGLTGPKLYGSNGCLGIGTTTMAGYTLAVAGKIRSAEVTIEHIDDWYDCVFEEDYPLTPLAEIEQFVKQNKHLPEVPSEAEVKANGIDLGEMNAILLKKIEELTLHVIQQQKEIDALKQAIK